MAHIGGRIGSYRRDGRVAEPDRHPPEPILTRSPTSAPQNKPSSNVRLRTSLVPSSPRLCQVGGAKPVSGRSDPPYRYIKKRTLNVGGGKNGFGGTREIESESTPQSGRAPCAWKGQEKSSWARCCRVPRLTLREGSRGDVGIRVDEPRANSLAVPGDHVQGAGRKDLVERDKSVSPRSQRCRKGGFRVTHMTRYQIRGAKPVSGNSLT